MCVFACAYVRVQYACCMCVRICTCMYGMCGIYVCNSQVEFTLTHIMKNREISDNGTVYKQKHTHTLISIILFTRKIQEERLLVH